MNNSIAEESIVQISAAHILAISSDSYYDTSVRAEARASFELEMPFLPVIQHDGQRRLLRLKSAHI
jgi:hypothetical protein